MLPESLLRFSVERDLVVPHFLGEHDHPWLLHLLEEHDRFVGRRQWELDAHLREPPSTPSPSAKRALAIHVLKRIWRSERKSAIVPRCARAAIFGEAAGSGDSRDQVLAKVAGSLGVTVPELMDSLFADLPSERRIAPPEKPISAGELALRGNLAIAQAFIFRAMTVTIEAEGNARAVVRHAKLRGLICTIAAREKAGDAILELSGPFSLFRRTLLYGRALGEIVPLLAWCRRFRLRARCMLNKQSFAFQLASGDPIFPSAEPRTYDSRLEERFARDFRRKAPHWDIVREPEPIEAGQALLFPDFALTDRRDPTKRWLLEIVGFWTPEYVAKKLALYRAAGLSNLILCIDAERDCAESDLPRNGHVLRFRRRVDAGEVLRLIDGSDPGSGT